MHDVWQRAREGDHEAFAEILLVFEPVMRRFILSLIGPTAQEDDIVQNTFLALYRNLARLKTVEHLRPFVFRVVRNQCYDELRRRGRYDTVPIADLPLVDHRPPVDEQAHWSIVYAEVQEHIQSLPENQRQMLLLYVEAGLSYREIAEALSISIGTVKSRLHHAKKTLKRLIGGKR